MTSPPQSPGLKIIQLPGRYGYSTTLVGWVEHVMGDWWRFRPGYRSIVRTSGSRKLGELAADGPQRDHTLSDPIATDEPFHALVARRWPTANESAWAEHCPRPKDWSES